MKILVVPDCQIKEGVPTEHLEWAGKAICDYRPDVVINIGDFADMPSLSTHDVKGSKYFEGHSPLQIAQRPCCSVNNFSYSSKEIPYFLLYVELR